MTKNIVQIDSVPLLLRFAAYFGISMGEKHRRKHREQERGPAGVGFGGLISPSVAPETRLHLKVDVTEQQLHLTDISHDGCDVGGMS